MNENEETKRMHSLIKNFLETTIDERAKREISFKQELQFINQYLGIEKVHHLSFCSSHSLFFSPGI
jgi:hypothetical protein